MSSIRRWWIPVLALLAIGALGCPKKLPDVVVDGQALPYEEAATQKFAIAEGLRADGKMAQAQTAYEVFLAEFPKSKLADDALYELGRMAEAKGDLKKAHRSYQRAVVEFAGDRSTDARLRLGIVGSRLGRHDEAVSVLKTIEGRIKGKPEIVQLWAAMGESLHALNKDSLAAFYWLRLARRTPQEPVAAWLRERAALALESEENPKRLTALVKEFKTDPIAPRLVIRLAEVRFRKRDYNGAKNAAKALVERYPSHPAAERARRILKSVEASESADPRAVGVAMPLTGPYAGFGQKALQSVLLAAGVFGPTQKGETTKFRLAIRDTAGNPSLAAQAIEELYIEDRVIAVIGGLLSDESEASAARAQALGLPFITLAQRRTASDDGNYVFRNSLTSTMQTRAMAAFSFDRLGAKRYAILYPDTPNGRELMNLFWDEVESRGGEIVAVEKYEAEASDFREPVERLVARHRDYIGAREDDWRKAQREAREQGKKSWEAELDPIIDFDAVFIPDYYKPAAQALGFFALADVPIGRFKPRKSRDPIIPLGIHSWNSPELVQRGERYVEGAYFVDAFFPESQEPEAKKFVQSFVGTYLRVPDVLDALVYDSASLVMAQLKAGATSRKKVRSGLADLKDWRGAAGSLEFDKRGEPQRTLTVLTVQRKEIQPVRMTAASAKDP